MKNYKVVSCKLQNFEKENFLRCVENLNPDGLYRNTASTVLRSLLIFFIYNGENFLNEILSIGISSVRSEDCTTISTRLKLSDYDQMEYYVKKIRSDYKLYGHNINVSGIMRRLIFLYTSNPFRWEQIIKKYKELF